MHLTNQNMLSTCDGYKSRVKFSLRLRFIVFPYDVTVAILTSQNNEIGRYVGVQELNLFSYVNIFSNTFSRVMVTWVQTVYYDMTITKDLKAYWEGWRG